MVRTRNRTAIEVMPEDKARIDAIQREQQLGSKAEVITLLLNIYESVEELKAEVEEMQTRLTELEAVINSKRKWYSWR